MSKDLAATLGMDLASESSKPGIAGLTSLHEVSFPNEALWCSECDSKLHTRKPKAKAEPMTVKGLITVPGR